LLPADPLVLIYYAPLDSLFSEKKGIFQRKMPKSSRNPSLRKTQWEFYDSEFLSTPSRKSGIEFHEEQEKRLKGCLFIEKIGKLVKMYYLNNPRPVDQINMGKVLLNRFYMRASLKDFNYRSIAAAILFIAGKLGSGENFVKIETLLPLAAKESRRDDVDTSEGSPV
jgi:hypothetical protein